MIWFIIFICCFIVLLGVALALVSNIKDCEECDKISFKESLDLTDLPIITFLIDNKKYNFLLDTGANLSVINESILGNISHEDTNEVGSIIGMEGNNQEVRYTIISLSYKNNKYKEKMQIVNMDNAFNSIKQESGVTLHGILGNAFFQKYKYILDFNELVAYSKENK